MGPFLDPFLAERIPAPRAPRGRARLDRLRDRRDVRRPARPRLHRRRARPRRPAGDRRGAAPRPARASLGAAVGALAMIAGREPRDASLAALVGHRDRPAVRGDAGAGRRHRLALQLVRRRPRRDPLRPDPGHERRGPRRPGRGDGDRGRGRVRLRPPVPAAQLRPRAGRRGRASRHAATTRSCSSWSPSPSSSRSRRSARCWSSGCSWRRPAPAALLAHRIEAMMAIGAADRGGLLVPRAPHQLPLRRRRGSHDRARGVGDLLRGPGASRTSASA